jgi:hypothetical protein
MAGARSDAGAGDATGMDRAIVAFVRALRAGGLSAPVDSALAYAAALAEVGVSDRTAAYWAGRATLVHRPEDVGLYDRTFAAFYDGIAAPDADLPPPAPEVVTVLLDSDDAPAADDDAPEPEPLDGPVLTLRWSDREVLRDKDFAACTTASSTRPTASWPTCAWSARPAGRAGSAPPGGAASTWGAPPAEPCAPGASPSGGPTARRAPGPGAWCCSATCRAPWSPTPAPWCASRTPRWWVGVGSRCSPSGPG